MSKRKDPVVQFAGVPVRLLVCDDLGIVKGIAKALWGLKYSLMRLSSAVTCYVPQMSRHLVFTASRTQKWSSLGKSWLFFLTFPRFLACSSCRVGRV